MSRNIAKGFTTGLGFAAAFALVGSLLASKNQTTAQSHSGPARLAGKLLRVSQRQDAKMGLTTLPGGETVPEIEKAPGEKVNVAVTWAQETTDAEGQAIPWPTQARVDLIQLSNGAVLASQCDAINGCGGFRLHNPGSGKTFTTQLQIPTSVADNTILAVRARIYMLPSLDDGTPDFVGGLQNPVLVDEAYGDNAVRVSIQASAQPAGGVWAVTVSQQLPTGAVLPGRILRGTTMRSA